MMDNKKPEARSAAEAMLDMARKIVRNAQDTSSAIAADIAFSFFFTPQRIKHRLSELNLGEPKVKVLDVQRTSGKVNCYSWGDGPRVICVHGWSGGGAQFKGFIAALVEAGYEAIAFDAPGHAESSGDSTDTVEIARLIDAIKREYGDIHGVISHSFGGVATLYAQRTFKLGAEKIVLIATPDPDFLLDKFVELMQLGQETASILQEKIKATYLERGIDNTTNFSVAHADELAAILLIQDSEDEEISLAESEDLRKKLGDIDYLGTIGLGHYKILNSPQVVARTLDFLAGHAE